MPSNQRHQLWLWAGIVMTFAMALLWALDESLRYLLAGISVFCFFKYYHEAPRDTVSNDRPSSRPQRDSATVSQPLDKALEEIQRGFSGTTTSQWMRGIFLVFGTVFFFIVIVVVIILFNMDDEYLPDAYYQAEQFNADGNYDSALYYYRIAARDNPYNPDIYMARGSLFLNLGKYDSAVVQFTRAAELNDEDAEAYFNKGYAYYLQGRYREAIREENEAVFRQPDHINARLLIGDSYYSQQQYDSAMVWYRDVYDEGYRNSVLSHIMAYILDTQGKTDQAITHYKEVVELDATNVEVMDRLAELLSGDEGNVYRNKAAQFRQQNGSQ